MRTKFVFKRLGIVFMVLLLFTLFCQLGSFTAYAAGFSNHLLSSDGGVKASYNETTKTLTISGGGTIEFIRWVAMAQKINSAYYDTAEAWGGTISEDNMKIVFSGNAKAIKLCSSGGQYNSDGLFENFSGLINFYDAVDLAPDATNLSDMFKYAVNFNQKVNFNTANVTDMSGMFYHATNFNQPVEFDTGNVTSMVNMFNDASSFNQPVDFDTGNVAAFSLMFYEAVSFNQPIFFDISSAAAMGSMFKNSAVEQVILRNSASNQNILAGDAFKDCSNLRYLSFSGLKYAKIDNFAVNYRVLQGSNQSQFRYSTQGFDFLDNLPYRVSPDGSWLGYTDFQLSADGGVTADYNHSSKIITVSGAGEIEYDGWAAMAQLVNHNYFGIQQSWDENIDESNMTIVFSGSPKAIKLCGTEKAGHGLFGNYSGHVNFNGAVDIAPGVTDLSRMFFRATQFNEPVDFNTADVKNMQYMFFGATSFNRPVSFNTASVTDMSDMFYDATSFNKQISFDTGNVVDMSEMFAGATAFNKKVNFNTQNVESFYEMFAGATAFNQSVTFNISSAQSIVNMFYNSAVKGITFTNSAGNQDVDATTAFNGCDDLNYLKFSGLNDATIEGFSGDYYVRENGGEPVAKTASSSYSFTDNANCRVYLQSRVPHVTLSGNGNGIKVSWTAVAGATGYQVYRADKRGGPYTKYNTTGGLVYTNTGNLVAGMPYFYKVRHYKKYGPTTYYGEFSEIKGYYAPGTLATPAKPSLTLDKNGAGIRLNWNAQKRITGYQVFRSLSPDKPFSYLKTASGNATKYTNLSGLTPGRPFYYKIRAYRMAKGVRKYSAFSDIKGLFAGTDEQALGAVSFSLEDNPSVSAPNVRVRWTGVSGADGYCVYRWNSAAQNWTGLKKTGPNARVYTNINGVVNHKTNFYGMRTYHVSSGTTYYGNIGQAKGYRVDK